MPDQIQIPLLPLQTVLFPGQLLPLQIFEERYQTMIHEVLGKQGTFGVVLIKQGQEVGGPAEPFEVGTTAQMKQIDRHPDGNISLICTGDQRFRIRDLDASRPFLSATVEYWPWQGLDQGVDDEKRYKLKGLLKGYLRTLSELVGSRLMMTNLPRDPFYLASLAGFALRIPNREKQSILTTNTLDEFVDLCIQFLHREINALHMTASIPDIPENDSPKLN